MLQAYSYVGHSPSKMSLKSNLNHPFEALNMILVYHIDDYQVPDKQTYHRAYRIYPCNLVMMKILEI